MHVCLLSPYSSFVYINVFKMLYRKKVTFSQVKFSSLEQN